MVFHDDRFDSWVLVRHSFQFRKELPVRDALEAPSSPGERVESLEVYSFKVEMHDSRCYRHPPHSGGDDAGTCKDGTMG